MRFIQKAVLIGLLILCGSSSAVDLKNTDLGLEYWYNYYFEPEYLQNYHIVDSFIYPPDYPAVVEPYLKIEKLDPKPIEENPKSDFPIIRKQLPIKPEDIHVPDIAVIDSRLVEIFYKDRKLRVPVIIEYEGDLQKLSDIGVSTDRNYDERVTTSVSLSLLPDLDTLKGIKWIRPQPFFQIGPPPGIRPYDPNDSTAINKKNPLAEIIFRKTDSTVIYFFYNHYVPEVLDTLKELTVHAPIKRDWNGLYKYEYTPFLKAEMIYCADLEELYRMGVKVKSADTVNGLLHLQTEFALKLLPKLDSLITVERIFLESE